MHGESTRGEAESSRSVDDRYVKYASVCVCQPRVDAPGAELTGPRPGVGPGSGLTRPSRVARVPYTTRHSL